MSLDLLFVNVGGSKKKAYQDLSKELSAIEPPFWAALTANFFRERGYDVNILDANKENLDYEETSKKIEGYSPKITNIVVYGQHPSASTQLMTSVGKLCKTIKENNPERKIILTGLHPSAIPERTIKEENCDFVCEGEGFYTLQGLLEKKEFEKIPGLWWKKDKEIFHTERAPNIQNLSEELNGVAWDLIPDLKGYRAHNWHCLDNLEGRENYASISTSVGCPYHCDFCSIHATFGEHKTRFWSPEWVLKQIDYLVNKKGVKNLKIIDEEFTLNPHHFIPIAEGLIERNYGLNIWAYTRVNNIPNEENLEKLKKAGINWLSPGIESGEENVRKKSKLGYKDEDINKKIKEMQNAGINVLGNFIFGIPGEDFGSMQKTLNLAKELNCEFVNFYCAMAWPGSALYNRAIKSGVKLPKEWEDYAQHSYGFLSLPTEKLSSEEILKFRDAAFNDYFTNPEYLKKIENKFGMRAREHILDMAKIKLKRKILGD